MLGAFEHQLVCFLYMPYEVHPLHFSSIFVGGGCEPVEKGWELGAGLHRIGRHSDNSTHSSRQKIIKRESR